MKTKQSSLTRLLVALLALLPMVAAADEVQLASWTFNTGYDVSENVYTPNAGAWAEVGTQWFNAGAPQIVANEAVGTKSDYIVTGKTSRYWQLCAGWNNHVFRIVNDTEANSIADVTDGSAHDNYYEVQFPAKGYKNIALKLACAYGGNAEATMNAVFSTDGGTTWKEAGTYTSAGTWWTYNEGTLSIPVADKEKVLVRLLFGNGFSSNWNLDYLTITGEKYAANPNAIELPNGGASLDLSKATLSNGVVKTDGVDVPQFDSFRNPGSATFVLNNTKAGAVYSVSLGAATANAGNTLNLVITDNATGAVEMDKTISVEANGWQNFTTYTATTGQMADGEKTFVVNFLSGGGYTSNVNNIVFTELDVADLALLTTNASPTGAGRVTVSPNNSAFAPGTEVTLTATANRGYEFTQWTDAVGNSLSADNPYTFTINGNTQIVAQFAEAEVLNTIPTSEDTPWVMENGELHGSRASFGADHHIDWMNTGDYANYRLDNKVDAAYYTVDFTAGTQQDNVTLDFNIKNDVGDVVCNQTVEIENNGNWDSASRSYTFRTQEMPKGKYTMTVTFNSVGGNGTTANINNFAFTAKEKFVAETVDNQLATVTFAYDKGAEGQTGVYSEGAEGWFKNNYNELGADVYIKGTGSVGGTTQTQVNPRVNNDGAPSEGNAINFYIIPKKGLTFTPTKVSFKTTRYGTDGGNVDAVWVNSDGTTIDIEKEIKPARNNATPNITEVSKAVTGAAASDGLCGLRLHLYKLGDTKQVGFSDVVIEGTVNGATQPIDQYAFAVACDPAEAGKIKVTPAGDKFDEGDEITVSVEENFGYHFKAWVDADGKEVSTDNPYTFAIAADISLKATFDKKNTYALNLTLTEGARDNLVEITPAGTDIDGKRMYEEGTEVKLTAKNNKILTFTGWEDNTTDAERIVKMDAEQNLTANFSAVDYIVGWDLYYDQPATNRAADYKSDSENAGMLSLRKPDGTTAGWLTRGIGNGFENGRAGGRVWKLRSEGYYFEISFSSKGYTNLKLSNGMGVSYNTYSKFDVEYSTDGEHFTKFGEFALQSGWVDGEFSLPAEANEQDKVYIRWMGDKSSELVGASTDYDGLCIGDIFVTADAGSLADEKAVLVSSNPENGATGISRNGSIILNFDKKIKAGTGKATLGGEEIAPIISGRSAIFKYSGLKYNTPYTFSMPEGVLTSRSGNAVAAATIAFTTMERQQPEPRLYDAIVAQDGSGDYTTLQAAIDAAPAGRAKPWLIFVENGSYNEHIDIPASKPYLHIIGQDRDKTVVLDNRLSGGENAYSVDPGATVVVKGANTFFENITLENSYGHEKQAGPQALALNTQADRVALNNVALLSYQDTWITTSTSNNRHYIKNSLIEGAVDFIYNSGNVYLDGDTLEINRPSGGYIVAPSHSADVKWGYVFQNNIIRARKGVTVTDVWLGRPWHNNPKTVFINTQTFVNIPAKGWYEHMGGLPTLWADYNTVDADGNPVDLSLREDTYWIEENGVRKEQKAKNYLTAEEAAQYTIKNVMGGDDNWQPDLLCEACDAPVVQLEGSTVAWQAVPYAICYVVTQGDKVLSITKDLSYTLGVSAKAPTGSTESPVKVQAVNEYGGLSQAGIAGDATAVNQVTATSELVLEGIYAADGTRLAAPAKGINLMRYTGKDGKVIVKKVLY